METITNVDLPLVSCLCLTRNRPAYLKRAIDCFLAQTYPYKELVILMRDDDHNSKEVVQQVNKSNIKYFEYGADQQLTLGEVRNLSIEKCTGDYFCQWDDDDWYHNQRLQIQVGAVLNNYKMASVLALLFVYSSVSNKTYLSSITPWPQTLLCKKAIYNDTVRYPGINQFEDMRFLLKLQELNGLYPVVMPFLYLYSYHGSNTYNAAHFENIFSTSQPLSDYTNKLITSIFATEISNAEASEQLKSPRVLEELDYLHDWNQDFKS